MGMSAHAYLAWGVDLAAEDNEDEGSDVRDAIEELLEGDWDLDKFFGFTEEFPAWPEDRSQHEAHRSVVEAYEQRQRGAVPVEFETYGHCDYSVHALVVRRTQSTTCWGCEPITDVVALQPPIPDGAEEKALNAVLDAIGFKGDRTPKLLLMAYYG